MSMKLKVNLTILIFAITAFLILPFLSSNIKVNATENLVNVKVYAEQFNYGKGGTFNLSSEEGGVSIDKVNYTAELNIDKSINNRIYISTASNYELDGIYAHDDFSGEKITGTLDSGVYSVDVSNIDSANLYVKLTIKRAKVILESNEDFVVSGAGTYLYGSQIMIDCTTSNDYAQFSKWVKTVGETETIFSNSKNYVFTVDGDIRLKPIAKYYFKPTCTNGIVNVYKDDILTNETFFESGTNLKVEAVANRGYNFVDYTGEFAGRNETFNVTITTWHDFSAIFESKTVTVQISTNDAIHSNLSGTTLTQDVNFSVGDTITILLNIDEKYKLVNWSTSCKGYFNRLSINQTYTITPDDAEQGLITFEASIIQVYAQVNVTIFGGGNVQVNNTIINTSLDKIIEIGESYKLQFFPKYMYELTKVNYRNNQTTTNLFDDIENNSLTIDIMEDCNIDIYYTRILWSSFAKEPTGSGTEKSPYVINTPEELAFIAYAVNNNIKPINRSKENYTTAVYRIEKNLDLSGKYWQKVGANFRGTLDVNFKILSGVTLENETTTSNFNDLFSGKFNLKRDINSLWTTVGILISVILAGAIIFLLIWMNKSKPKVKKVIIIPKNLDKF